MAKRTRTYDDKMKLDMPFAEALERFAGTKPAEMHANIKRAKQKKPPGGKKAPPGNADDPTNVESLRDRRMRKRNYGR
jgi:hypothetical protein